MIVVFGEEHIWEFVPQSSSYWEEAVFVELPPYKWNTVFTQQTRHQ